MIELCKCGEIATTEICIGVSEWFPIIPVMGGFCWPCLHKHKTAIKMAEINRQEQLIIDDKRNNTQ